MKHRRIKYHILMIVLSIFIALLLFQIGYVLTPQPKVKKSEAEAKPVVHPHQIVRPATSNDVLLNPGKGWVLYGTPSNQTASTMAYATVGYVRYDWADIEPTEGQYNWSIIDNDLNAWVTQGKQFAFGVMNADSSSNAQYVTPNWVFADGAASVKCQTFDDLTGRSGVQYEPVWDDPIFLQKVQDFVTAMAQRYDNNPHIAYVDIRSYGNWGEGHVYGISPSVPLSAAGVQTHIQLYRNAFKHVQTIVPWGTSDTDSAYSWAVNNGVGMRRDGLMVDSDGSELQPAYGKRPAVYEFYGSYQWLVANGYWSDAKLSNDLMVGRPSYIGMGQWDNDAQVMLANEQPLVSQLANRMGYYFVLEGANIPTAISDDQATNIILSWDNQGVAYLYQPAKVAVALLDSSNNVVQKQWLTTSNPNTWTPGQTTTDNVPITFSGVSTGTYKLAVGLFQNTSDSNPIYEIGNQGRTANGWYVLSSTVTALSGTSCQSATVNSKPTTTFYPCSFRKQVRPVLSSNAMARRRSIKSHRSTR